MLIHRIGKAYRVPPHEIMQWHYPELVITKMILTEAVKERHKDVKRILGKKNHNHTVAFLASLYGDD